MTLNTFIHTHITHTHMHTHMHAHTYTHTHTHTHTCTHTHMHTHTYTHSNTHTHTHTHTLGCIDFAIKNIGIIGIIRMQSNKQNAGIIGANSSKICLISCSSSA